MFGGLGSPLEIAEHDRKIDFQTWPLNGTQVLLKLSEIVEYVVS